MTAQQSFKPEMQHVAVWKRQSTESLYSLCSSLTEMAERHDVQHILRIARELVHKVQTLIENKWEQE